MRLKHGSAKCALFTFVLRASWVGAMAAEDGSIVNRGFEHGMPTRIPEVQKARDVFFNDPLFLEKGIWHQRGPPAKGTYDLGLVLVIRK